MRILYTILYVVLLLPLNLSFANSSSVNIVTTTYPLFLMVKDLTGDLAEVDYIIPKDDAPHNYPLKPGDIKKIKSADVFIFIGNEFNILNLHKRNNLEFINVSETPNLNIQDEHFIFNIKNSILISEVISRKLSKYINNTDKLRSLSTSFKQKLDVLDRSNRRNLATYKNHAYISIHDSFIDFTKPYTINSLGSIVPPHEELVKPSDIIRLKDIFANNVASCLVYEDGSELIGLETLIPDHLKKVKISVEKFVHNHFSSYDMIISYLSDQFLKCFES